MSGGLKKVGELQTELRKKEEALASAQSAKVKYVKHSYTCHDFLSNCALREVLRYVDAYLHHVTM